MTFSKSLTTKCRSLNNEPCMTRPILINLNPVELTYYLFIVSLDKCNGSCNTTDYLSTKIFVPSETNGTNVISV